MCFQDPDDCTEGICEADIASITASIPSEHEGKINVQLSVLSDVQNPASIWELHLSNYNITNKYLATFSQDGRQRFRHTEEEEISNTQLSVVSG